MGKRFLQYGEGGQPYSPLGSDECTAFVKFYSEETGGMTVWKWRCVGIDICGW